MKPSAGLFFVLIWLVVTTEVHTLVASSLFSSRLYSSASSLQTTVYDAPVSAVKPINGLSPSTSTWKPQPTSYSDGDSIERFQADVTRVLKSVYEAEEDLTIPSLYRSRNPSFTSVWTNDDWKVHTSRWRFLRYLREFPTSRLLRRCGPQLTALAVWTLVSFQIGTKPLHNLPLVNLSLGPLGLISSFLALLLTLRTNQGLTRLGEGRQAFSKAMMVTREMAQITTTSIIPRDEQLGLLIARHISLFGWCLKKHIRGTWNTTEEVASIMLPQFKDAHFVTDYTRKQPAAILLRIRQTLEALNHPDHPHGPLPVDVQETMGRCLLRLQESIAGAESIRNNPVPPLYTTHATRLLVFYLCGLPLAVHKAVKHNTTAFVVTMAVGFAMFGLDEISHLLENPFRLMPLYQVSKATMMDVADVIVLPLPTLYACKNSSTISDPAEYDFKKPGYW